MFGLFYGFYCSKMIDVAKGFIMLSAINGERTQHIPSHGAGSPDLQLRASFARPPRLLQSAGLWSNAVPFPSPAASQKPTGRRGMSISNSGGLCFKSF